MISNRILFVLIIMVLVTICIIYCMRTSLIERACDVSPSPFDNDKWAHINYVRALSVLYGAILYSNLFEVKNEFSKWIKTTVSSLFIIGIITTYIFCLQ